MVKVKTHSSSNVDANSDSISNSKRDQEYAEYKKFIDAYEAERYGNKRTKSNLEHNSLSSRLDQHREDLMQTQQNAFAEMASYFDDIENNFWGEGGFLAQVEKEWAEINAGCKDEDFDDEDEDFDDEDEDFDDEDEDFDDEDEDLDDEDEDFDDEDEDLDDENEDFDDEDLEKDDLENQDAKSVDQSQKP